MEGEMPTQNPGSGLHFDPKNKALLGALVLVAIAAALYFAVGGKQESAPALAANKPAQAEKPKPLPCLPDLPENAGRCILGKIVVVADLNEEDMIKVLS